MTTRLRISVILVAGVLLAWTLGARAQQAPGAASAQTAALSDVIPVDPQITVGQLPNGLRYYVRVNNEPQNRAELRLVVNVGSTVEDDDQRGLAHFAEHMAFNGTTNFPKQDVITFLESIGMRFGRDLNASTSFDETIYMLDVPTDRPGVLDRAMLVLEDWSRNLTFDPAEIDKERGVIIEEWRLRRGASSRILDKQLPILLQGSRYADRLPIGTVDVLQNFPHDRLRQFYRDWYRPDLMAVVAVGDFDAAAVEAMIRRHFESMPAAASPRPRPAFTVPDRTATVYALATDPEQATTSVSVYNTFPLRDQTTVGAYRQHIVENLYASMLNDRFAEISQKPDAPWLGAGAGRGMFVRTLEVYQLSAQVRDGETARGLEALLTETERVERFGFTAPELERAKTNTLRSLERAVAEKDRQPSSSLAAEYGRNFLQREPIPGIVYEHALYQRFLPEITLDEVNALAKVWGQDRNRIVAVSAPEKTGVAPPSEQALAAVLENVARKDLTAYTDTASSAPLLAAIPEAGSVVNAVVPNPAWGITEWTLSNGVRVVLKPTDFKEDEILFAAFSPGGTSLAPDADFIPARTAAQVVSMGGVGELSALDLQKVLTGKVASASPTIGSTSEGLTGGGSAKDLETLFQLIHLRFTQPRADAQLFRVVTEQTKSALANQTATPEFAFSEALSAALTQNHLRARPMTPALVDEMDLDKSFAFYKDRFADASDFTFVFVGSFTPDAIKPLVERYLASLPSLRRQESWKDLGIRPMPGIVERRVEKGIEPKSQTTIVFSGPFQYDQEHRAVMRAMAMIFQNKLREVLREDLGGTYSVGVTPQYSKIPREEYEIRISFGSSPDRADMLAQRVFQEIAAFKASTPSDQVVRDTRETMLRDYEVSVRQNGFFRTELAARYQHGEDLKDLFNLQDFYRALTPQAIQDAARQYFTDDAYVKVMLFPAN